MRHLLSTLALVLPTISLAATERVVIDAPVVSVTPIFEQVTQRIPHERCREERTRVIERGRPGVGPTLVGAVLGGTVAGALGHNSRHQDVIAGVGAVAGAAVGNDIARQHRRDDVYYVSEEVCRVEYELRDVEREAGYRVSYQVGDNIYETTRDREPGSTIPVRVEIKPLP